MSATTALAWLLFVVDEATLADRYAPGARGTQSMLLTADRAWCCPLAYGDSLDGRAFAFRPSLGLSKAKSKICSRSGAQDSRALQRH